MAFSMSLPFDALLLGNFSLALGGTFVFLPFFHLSNAFPQYSGLILSCITGAFDASAAFFVLFRRTYFATNGRFGLREFFLLYLTVPAFILVAQLFIMPARSYDTRTELEVKMEIAEDPANDVHDSDDELSDEAEIWKARIDRSSMRKASIASLQQVLGTQEQRLEHEKKEEEIKIASGVWGALHGMPAYKQMQTPWFILITIFTVLQEAFDCPLVIMLTDDEKFMHSDKITIKDAKRFALENSKDIIALGFDPAKTFIFSDFEFVSGAFYENMCLLAKHTTFNQIRGTFGFDEHVNIGKIHFPATQSATAFATSFPHIFGADELKTRNIPCLIPCAIDQDPYFRQCRDRAEKLKHKKPSLLHMLFLPALQGPGSKMSASVSTSAIFLSDTPSQIKTKINKYAFSGGQDTAEKQRALGGRADIDVPFQYLTFFLEDDDELERIRTEYESGQLMTGEIKAICIKHLQTFVAEFQERRKAVSEEVRADFFARKPLLFRGRTAEEMMNEAEERRKREKAEAKAKPKEEPKPQPEKENVTQQPTETESKPNAANAKTVDSKTTSDTAPKTHKKNASTISVGRSKA